MEEIIKLMTLCASPKNIEKKQKALNITTIHTENTEITEILNRGVENLRRSCWFSQVNICILNGRLFGVDCTEVLVTGIRPIA